MINLDDWQDYKASNSRINFIKSLPQSRPPRLCRLGIDAYLEQNGFVKEDRQLAKSMRNELFGDRT